MRPIKLDDFDPISKLTNDRSMWIYFTSDLSEKAELKNWLDTAVFENEKKIRLAFTVIDKSTNNPISSTSFGNISYRDKRIEIGWTWICKAYQGKGINDRMKYLMMKYSFDTLEFERIEFKTDVLNLPARKALLRIGAKEEGVLRSHTLMTHNRRRDTIYYSILKSEWSEMKIKSRWEIR
ncbi:MAG: GNAT family protein [Ignavibacteria bacterium]|nr:GNAT family protein [Ignavibacteria bacterium]